MLKFQSITSTQSFIRNPNIFEIFNIKCSKPNFLPIRENSCVQLENSQLIVKVGLINNLNYPLDLLKPLQDQQQKGKMMKGGYFDICTDTSFDFINKHPLLDSWILWHQRDDHDHVTNKDNDGLLKDFIDTIITNLTKSKNDFRYDGTINKFALSLHILGRKLTYEFIRLYLP